MKEAAKLRIPLIAEVHFRHSEDRQLVVYHYDRKQEFSAAELRWISEFVHSVAPVGSIEPAHELLHFKQCRTKGRPKPFERAG